MRVIKVKIILEILDYIFKYIVLVVCFGDGEIDIIVGNFIFY